MKKKKIALIVFWAAIIAFALGVVITIGIMKKRQYTTEEGIITEVNSRYIEFESSSLGGKCRVILSSDILVLDRNGKEMGIQEIQVGQYIIAKYRGGLPASEPAQMYGAFELRIE